MPRGETVLGRADGMCAAYRNSLPLYPAEPTSLALTPHRLVFTSDKRSATVDLVAVYDLEPMSDRDRMQGITITAVRDRAPGFTTWTFTTTVASDFLVALRRAVALRHTQAPQRAYLLSAWGDEMRRRNLATAEIAEILRAEDTDPFIGAIELPVVVRTLAFEAAQARLDPMFAMNGSIQALRDGRVVVQVDVEGENSPIAMFRGSDVTFVTVPVPSSDPAAGGMWEIGFRSRTGERRVIFTGPGQALYGGNQLSANALLGASGLLSRGRVLHSGASWLACA